MSTPAYTENARLRMFSMIYRKTRRHGLATRLHPPRPNLHRDEQSFIFANCQRSEIETYQVSYRISADATSFFFRIRH